MEEIKEIKYVGFWKRLIATVIDTVIMMLITMPILLSVYGKAYFTSKAPIKGAVDFIVSYILPAVFVIFLWKYKSATPGKMIIKSKIVDADTGGLPTNKQLVIRFFAYLVSSIPMGLGFIWIAFDKKKQSWHDKMAKTLVIYT
ncbi:MAG: RDD family protein [Desulfobacterales bacterium]|nr:RDD family protein [Desulfobacterales bacterium]